jgi:hypothetical protein
MSDLGVIFPPWFAPDEFRSAVSTAEAVEIPQLWVWEDCFQQSGLATAVAALGWTERLTVGVGLMPVPLRNVVTCLGWGRLTDVPIRESQESLTETDRGRQHRPLGVGLAPNLLARVLTESNHSTTLSSRISPQTGVSVVSGRDIRPLQAVLVGLVTVAVAAGQLAISIPADASQTMAARTISPYRPVSARVDLDASAGLVEVANKLYVSEDDQVKVFSATSMKELTTIPNVSGAGSMARSADGSTVYVAENGGAAIAAISTASDSVVDTGTTPDCPRSVSVTTTTIWYLAGCSAPYSLYSLDRSTLTGSTTPVDGLSTTATAQSALQADDAWLVLSAADEIDTYSIGDDDALTPSHTLDVAGAPEMALRGDDVYVGTSDTDRFDLTTGSPDGTFSGLSGGTPAVSSDGTKLGVGGQGLYDDNLYVFDTASGGKIVSCPADVGEYNLADIENLTFSDDGSRLDGVARYFTGSAGDEYHFYLFSSTTSKPSVQSLNLRVSSPKKYGRPMSAKATVSSGGQTRPGAHVTFQVTSNGQTRTFVKKANQAGVARLSTKVSYSGTVSAKATGDLNFIPTKSRTGKYVGPSKFRVAMTKPASKRHGIRYYTSAQKAVTGARLYPLRSGSSIDCELQIKLKGHWWDMQELTLATDANSIVAVRMSSAAPGVVYRITFTYHKNSISGPATAAGPAFSVKA